jgi:hypothetical protein
MNNLLGPVITSTHAPALHSSSSPTSAPLQYAPPSNKYRRFSCRLVGAVFDGVGTNACEVGRYYAGMEFARRCGDVRDISHRFAIICQHDIDRVSVWVGNGRKTPCDF